MGCVKRIEKIGLTCRGGRRLVAFYEGDEESRCQHKSWHKKLQLPVSF